MGGLFVKKINQMKKLNKKKKISMKRTIGKRRYCLMAAVIVLSFIMMPDALKMKAAAVSAGILSSGSISADNSAVAYYSTDIGYLGREADALCGEIDHDTFDLTEASGTVTVSGSRRKLLNSHGIINYGRGKVIADANDLLGLANQIDDLEDCYASTVYSALNTIGTYLDKDGVVYHEPREADSLVLTGFVQLEGGILQSQSITHPGYSPVTSDNITAGAAAWVNGHCIVGNGADNDRAYQRGLKDGEDGNREEVDIRYTYHTHSGDSGIDPIPDGHVCYSTANPGGCYKSSGHTHDKTGSCPKTHHTRCDKRGATGPGDPNGWACPVHGTRNIWSNDAGGGYRTWGCDYPMEWDEYTCSGVTNTWKIGCGKIAGRTVESAEVIINGNKDAGE